MIVIVNYGLGNIQAIVNIYRSINVPVVEAKTPNELTLGDRFILPGVGAFDWAISRLDQSGMRPELEKIVINDGRPILGICVGMQMLGQSSEEGNLSGLGWIPGTVKRFKIGNSTNYTQLPHMGWNDVRPRFSDSIFSGLEKDARFYFLHSFYFSPTQNSHVLAETDYGIGFASSICSRNVFGVQFHPEKSHHWGVRLLKNFAEI